MKIIAIDAGDESLALSIRKRERCMPDFIQGSFKLFYTALGGCLLLPAAFSGSGKSSRQFRQTARVFGFIGKFTGKFYIRSLL